MQRREIRARFKVGELCRRHFIERAVSSPVAFGMAAVSESLDEESRTGRTGPTRSIPVAHHGIVVS